MLLHILCWSRMELKYFIIMCRHIFSSHQACFWEEFSGANMKLVEAANIVFVYKKYKFVPTIILNFNITFYSNTAYIWIFNYWNLSLFGKVLGSSIFCSSSSICIHNNVTLNNASNHVTCVRTRSYIYGCERKYWFAPAKCSYIREIFLIKITIKWQSCTDTFADYTLMNYKLSQWIYIAAYKHIILKLPVILFC